MNERHYDDFDINRKMRKTFREEKAGLEDEKKPKNFMHKLQNLGNTDLRKVNQVDFKGLDSFRKNRKHKRDNIRTESIFNDSKNVKNLKISNFSLCR